jgi:CHAT domain-containing protein
VEAGRHLIDDWSITYLPTGRDLLRLRSSRVLPLSQGLVLADPDFNLGLTWFARLRARFTATRPPVVHGQIPVTASVDQTGKRAHPRLPTFKGLPETRREGRSIAKLLGVEPLLGTRALEAALRAQASPEVLHLATHGFFLAAEAAPSGDDAARGAVLEQVSAMMRSGIVLAGVNAGAADTTRPKEAGDGIVTAAEVSGLDLSGTQLVVLSACETGLGDVRTGEGVLGLRRAFAVAGARTVVMSLWRVPDTATRELMEAFYAGLRTRTPRGDALRQAQLLMRRRRARVRDWAAFICEGDACGLLLDAAPAGVNANVAAPRLIPAMHPMDAAHDNAP